MLKISRHPISLDRPGRRERGQLLRRLHRGRRAPRRPVNAATQEMLKDKIDQVLKTLTYREREIIKLRYGLGDGYTYTLEEVGRIFKVTRERVRQIEAKAVRKLQHPGPQPAARGLPREYRLTPDHQPPVAHGRPAVFLCPGDAARPISTSVRIDDRPRRSRRPDASRALTPRPDRTEPSTHDRDRRQPPRPPPAPPAGQGPPRPPDLRPKTLAARQAALANRQADLEKARKALQDAKVAAQEERALAPEPSQAKIDDLKVKLNQVKKNEEYKAIQNQIAHDKAAMGKIEDEILEGYETVETQAADARQARGRGQDVRRRGRRAAEADRVARPPTQKAQLDELEAAIIDAEDVIPEDAARALPPDRQAARRRRPGRRRERRLPRLLHLRHHADAQRADQRRPAHVLQELRPAPLPRRKRGRELARLGDRQAQEQGQAESLSGGCHAGGERVFLQGRTRENLYVTQSSPLCSRRGDSGRRRIRVWSRRGCSSRSDRAASTRNGLRSRRS